MRGKRCWHNPLVVRLMERLVYRWMMEASVDEVDQHVGEEQEEWELDEVVQPEGGVIRMVVQFGIAPNIEPEARRGQCGHADHAGKCLLNLHLDLILEEFGVLVSALVEH